MPQNALTAGLQGIAAEQRVCQSMNTIEELVEDLRRQDDHIMDDEDRKMKATWSWRHHWFVQRTSISWRATAGVDLSTLTPERCQQLRLPLMVNENDRPFDQLYHFHRGG